MSSMWRLHWPHWPRLRVPCTRPKTASPNGFARLAMREGWRRVRLGEVARLDLDQASVRPDDAYAIAGVWNAGQGLFSRSTISGSDTNYRTLQRLRAGQLVMRKLTAWEGTITTVS